MVVQYLSYSLRPTTYIFIHSVCISHASLNFSRSIIVHTVLHVCDIHTFYIYPREGLGLPTVHLELYQPYSIQMRLVISTLYSRMRQIFTSPSASKFGRFCITIFSQTAHMSSIYLPHPRRNSKNAQFWDAYTNIIFSREC